MLQRRGHNSSGAIRLGQKRAPANRGRGQNGSKGSSPMRGGTAPMKPPTIGRPPPLSESRKYQVPLATNLIAGIQNGSRLQHGGKTVKQNSRPPKRQREIKQQQRSLEGRNGTSAACDISKLHDIALRIETNLGAVVNAQDAKGT
eukprot:evm.model.scf_283.8 EVM.evm.TU.scf_283.8   scf_283:99585-101238(-)